jgi:hypothetical protein
VAISGSTAITSFGTATNTIRFIRFTATTLILTHNALSLILPKGANIQVAAGDTCIAQSDGSGNWRVTHYTRCVASVQGDTNNTPVSASAATGTAIVDIVIGPGKWRLTGTLFCVGTSANSYFYGAINSTSGAAQTGTRAKDRITFIHDATDGVGGGSIGPVDVTVTASTHYYLNAQPATNDANMHGYLRAEPII